MQITHHHIPPKYVLSKTVKKTVPAFLSSLINQLILQAIILIVVVYLDPQNQVAVTPTQLQFVKINSNLSVLWSLAQNHSCILSLILRILCYTRYGICLEKSGNFVQQNTQIISIKKQFLTSFYLGLNQDTANQNKTS